MRLRSIPVLALATAAWLAAPAVAAGPTIHASPATVQRGHVVRLHGRVPGCVPGDRVTLISRAFSRRHTFAGVPAVFAPLMAGHRYAVRARIPRTRRAGRYTVTGRCGGGNLGVAATLRVMP
jgi:hypothetical protein